MAEQDQSLPPGAADFIRHLMDNMDINTATHTLTVPTLEATSSVDVPAGGLNINSVAMTATAAELNSAGSGSANIPTADEKAGLAANTPTALNPVITLGQSIATVQKAIVAADVAALGAVLQGQIDFDAALPAGAIPVAAWIEKGTDWSGGLIATMTASIGISAGDVDRYVVPGNIFTGAGPGNLNGAGVAFDGTESPVIEGGTTVSVDFVSTVANLDQLIAGDLVAHFVYTLTS